MLTNARHWTKDFHAKSNDGVLSFLYPQQHLHWQVLLALLTTHMNKNRVSSFLSISTVSTQTLATILSCLDHSDNFLTTFSASILSAL